MEGASKNSILSEITRILSESELFQLTREKAEELSHTVDHLELPAGTVLFHQGEDSPNAFLLASGRLKVFSRRKDNSEELVGWIRPGETVGEMGLLSKRPRSLSVRTVEDSTLLCLDNGLIEQLPKEALLRFFQALNLRAHSTISRFYQVERKSETMVLVALTENTDIRNFALRLAKNWPDGRSVIVQDQEQVIQQNQNRSIQAHDPVSRTIQLITRDTFSHALSDANHVDRVILLADLTEDKPIDKKVLELAQLATKRFLPVDLVLWRSGQITDSSKTVLSIPGTRFFHVRSENTADFRRLARFMAGCPTGVTLGGGGVRGWAHIGAIQGIIEAGYHIDAIGGASAGAILGATWEISENHESYIENFGRLLEIAGNQLAISNLTLPVVSVFNGRRWNQALREIFGNQLIEDFSIPFHCVSCNFKSESQAVHTTGPVWKWLRASGSIPGLFPPVVEDQDLYVDGGVLNNLPVDVMKEFLGPGGQVIAVDISGSNYSEKSYFCPLEVSPLRALGLRKNARQQQKTLPSLSGTFLKSLMMASQSKTQENAALADILIQPDLGVTDMLSTAHKDYLIRKGYECAIKTLTPENQLNN